METLIPILVALPNIISAMVAVAALGTAAWQAFRTRDIKRGLELSDKTLGGLVATVALMPDTEQTRRLKETVKRLSESLGTEKTKLESTVKDVEKLLTEAGILSDGDDTGHVVRAAEAVRLWREKR